MLDDFYQNVEYIEGELRERGIGLTKKATRPLRRIDWSRMVAIYDHEESFLRDRFIRGLVEAHQARVGDGGVSGTVNEQDVRTAMLMLGAAVAEAQEEFFSENSKSVVIDVCPFC